ncbi:MAG: hypothetical protein M3Z67_07625 [Commensalibacter sp.]|nr:hypothetical protein [Commensalibacter sp.]
MVILYDLYSKRIARAERQKINDVYRYDEISRQLRGQIIHIANDLFKSSKESCKLWHEILQIIYREKGIFCVTSEKYLIDNNFISDLLSDTCQAFNECRDFISGTNSSINLPNSKNYNSADTLDVIDFCEILIQTAKETIDIDASEINQAIDELNRLFKEAGVGYEYIKETNQIIRLDNQTTHKEIVRPTLNILRDPKFQKSNEYYRKAHEYYRKGNNEECINECAKCFESVLQIICEQNKWIPVPTTTIQLIECVKNNGLFSSGLKTDKSLKQFIEMLKTGLPSVRTATSNGKAPDIQPIQDYIASYALHLTASNVLLLYKAQEVYQLSKA